MKVHYSPRVDAMYIKMNDNVVVSTKRVGDTIILNFGEDGEIVGIELLDASKSVADLSEVIYENPTKFVMPDEKTLKARREATAKARRKKNEKKQKI